MPRPPETNIAQNLKVKLNAKSDLKALKITIQKKDLQEKFGREYPTNVDECYNDFITIYGEGKKILKGLVDEWYTITSVVEDVKKSSICHDMAVKHSQRGKYEFV